MSDFSLDLNEDQLQLQKWVHDFAEGVMRPAAHEWDEREETPWPIIEEAANIGLYSFDFLVNGFTDSTGLSLPLVYEELSWGDAGIALALMGSSLAVAGIASNGTPEQLVEWAPQCFGTPGDLKLGAFCVSEADAGSDVSSLKTRAVRRGKRRVGHRRDEDLDHQWRHRSHQCGRRIGRTRARLAWTRELRSPRGNTRRLGGNQVQEDGDTRFAHR